MIYGDQWNCACGWSNLWLRKRCRNCDAAKPDAAQIESAERVLRRLQASQKKDATE